MDSLGTPLVIKLKHAYTAGEFQEILLTYQTTESSLAVQWYSAEMTLGKEHPFMYTQCEAILCRSLLPCQDTPSAKVKVNAALTVKKPLIPLYAGIKTRVIERDDEVTYYYSQKIPIPTYLIAIAAGALESRRLSARINVYGEKEIVDNLKNLNSLDYLIIDEADRMVELGHYEDLDKIIDKIQSYHISDCFINNSSNNSFLI